MAYDKLSEMIERHVGAEIRDRIMEGNEKAGKLAGPRRACWMKGVMERMDALVDEPTRIRIREQCGARCAWRGRGDKIAKLRSKCSTLEEFYNGLGAILGNGVGLERDGQVIYTSYPRCYCGAVKGTTEPISRTYCHCGKGYWMAMFGHALGRPVKVDLLQSVITGGATCRFAVHIPEDEF